MCMCDPPGASDRLSSCGISLCTPLDTFPLDMMTRRDSGFVKILIFSGIYYDIKWSQLKSRKSCTSFIFFSH